MITKWFGSDLLELIPNTTKLMQQKFNAYDH